MQRSDYKTIKESISCGDFKSASSVIKRLGGVDRVLGSLEPQPEAELTALMAVARWNTTVKSNKVLYDPTMDKSRANKLGVLCQEERFAKAFDEICRKCEAICSVVSPEEWRPGLWWLTGLSNKDGTANWYRILVGDFDFMAKSKKTKGNAALDRARAKYE